MTIKQFLEKAISGGWKEFPKTVEVTEDVVAPGCIGLRGIEENCTLMVSIYQVILDPKAWQAVGKVEGWGYQDHCAFCGYDWVTTNEGVLTWEYNMHLMITSLCQDKTIEEFLKTL